MILTVIMIRKDWRYQMGNQKVYIEEGQKTHWRKEKKKTIYEKLKMKQHEPLFSIKS